MRTKHTFRLPADLMTSLADYASRKGVSQSLVIEAALASHLSPDGADRLEAALARRLDRMTRHLERIERHVDISNEALAVFVLFWLTSTPALGTVRLAGVLGRLEQRWCRFEHPRDPRSIGLFRRLVREALPKIAVENGAPHLKQKMGAPL
jgi:hypothetical protein